ncbi:unnamed protein product, partial [Cyprideis torosa]
MLPFSDTNCIKGIGCATEAFLTGNVGKLFIHNAMDMVFQIGRREKVCPGIPRYTGRKGPSYLMLTTVKKFKKPVGMLILLACRLIEDGANMHEPILLCPSGKNIIPRPRLALGGKGRKKILADRDGPQPKIIQRKIMQIFIVAYHPEPKSYNNALLTTAQETLSQCGHKVRTSDLHAMSFNATSGRHNYTTVDNPRYFKQQFEELHASENDGFSPDIRREIENLEWCELLILQFPLWWFSLPAPLKGWVDRVFAMGRIYGNGRFYEMGVFQGKKAMLSLTTGAPQEAYQEDGFNGDISGILRPIHRGILAFTGFSVLQPNIVYGPAHLS